MRPSDILRREHVAIARLLDAMDGMSAALQNGDRLPRADVQRALHVVSAFGDKIHGAKEEHALFPEIGEIPEGDEIVRDLKTDHVSARRVIGFIAADAEAAELPDLRAKRTLAHHARVLVGLLRAHMRNEEKRLFPLADALDRTRAARVEERFREIDAGAPPGSHEHFEAEIGALYARYGAKGSSGAASSAGS